MVKTKTEFDPLPIEKYLKNYTKNKIRFIEKQAFLLGYKVLPMGAVS